MIIDVIVYNSFSISCYILVKKIKGNIFQCIVYYPFLNIRTTSDFHPAGFLPWGKLDYELVLVTLRNRNFNMTFKMQKIFYAAVNVFWICDKLLFLYTHFTNQRLALSNKIKVIEKIVFKEKDSLTIITLQFGDEKLSLERLETLLF